MLLKSFITSYINIKENISEINELRNSLNLFTVGILLGIFLVHIFSGSVVLCTAESFGRAASLERMSHYGLWDFLPVCLLLFCRLDPDASLLLSKGIDRGFSGNKCSSCPSLKWSLKSL